MKFRYFLCFIALFSFLFVGCKNPSEEKEPEEEIVDDGIREVELDFDGGASIDLYERTSSVASFTLNNYNTNSGSFWSGEYERCIFITDRANDPGAQFSDRVYIGKNPYTGYYEIVSIILSGISSWPTKEKGFDFDAMYVITVSESYSSYYKIHQKMLNLEVGQIVIIATPNIEGISKETPSNVKFYKKDIDIDKITYDETDFNGLPTPTKLGFNFLGWFNEKGERIEEIEEIDWHYKLKAKWEELNPVTDIKIEGMKEELIKDEELKLDVALEPLDAFFQKINYNSSNTDILTIDKDGNIKAINTGRAKITISDYMEKVVKEFIITVYPTDSLDLKFQTGFNGIMSVGEKVKASAEFFGKDSKDYEISYVSSNKDVLSVSDKGEMEGKKEGKSVLTVYAKKGDKEYSISYTITVGKKQAEDRIDEVLALISKYNFSNVQTINFCLFDDDLNKYYKATYGSVNYYLFDEFKVNTDYVAQAESNTRCRKTRRAVDTIEFVTVHDTATLIGSVEGVADYLSSDVTSIHYTVGDYKTLAVVPEKYIAYNAGDGTSMSFKWQASGVLANGNSEPKIGVTKVDNKWYFTINDELTKLSPSLSNGEKTIKDPSKALTSLGPVWTIIDGEYYIGNTQAVFSSNINGVIGAYGGNCNSIGIEMNVNSSGDMFDTLQRTAKLVADILIRNNLDLTRVKQHNTWTGKNCPQVLLAGHYWSEFMKMVEIEYILMKDFSDTKISFKSNNPLIVTKTGRIINAPTVTTVVTYDVTVEIEGVSKTITLEAIVPGRTTWQELNGMYPTTKIINGGYYIQ